MSNKHDLPPLPDIRDIVAVAHTKYCLDKYKSFEEAMFQETARAVRAQFTEHIQRLEAENEALKKDAERLEFLLRKVCFTGNGDGTCAMQIINLPCSVPGWPEPGEESVKAFARAAIDAAMTKEQET
jgi:hypothetical protein